MLTRFLVNIHLILVLSVFSLVKVANAAVYHPYNPAATQQQNDINLVNAVLAANTSSDDDVIDLQGGTFVFSFACNGTAVLPIGYPSCPYNNTGYDALPPITASATSGKLSLINGSIVRDIFSIDLFRLAELEPGANLSLRNITLQNGYATSFATNACQVEAHDEGGAIYNQGTLTILNSSLLNNTANDSGGAIYNNYLGEIDINTTTISDNIALVVSAVSPPQPPACVFTGSTGGGGGVFNANNGGTGIGLVGGTINSLDNSTIAQNISYGFGGGFNNQGNVNNISGTTVAYNLCCNSSIPLELCPENLTGQGGGIYNDGNSLRLQIANSTIANNGADLGGGIFNNWAPFNAGIQTTNVQIFNSTIAKNIGGSDGGGIYNNNNSNNRAVVAGTPAVIDYLVSTIIADNESAEDAAQDIENFEDPFGFFTPALINNHANNLVENNYGVDQTIYTGNSFNDIAGSSSALLDPRLDDLAYNGGFTQTIALLPQSPAKNSGINLLGLQYDQRGKPFYRSTCSLTDIGAYEIQDCN